MFLKLMSLGGNRRKVVLLKIAKKKMIKDVGQVCPGTNKDLLPPLVTCGTNMFIILVFYVLTVVDVFRTMSRKTPLNMMCVRFIIAILMKIH